MNIKINIDNDILFDAMLLAHEMDITFNELVHKALEEALEESLLNNNIEHLDDEVQEELCKWTVQDEFAWQSGCGKFKQGHGIDTQTVRKFKYCPFCAKSLIIGLLSDDSR